MVHLVVVPLVEVLLHHVKKIAVQLLTAMSQMPCVQLRMGIIQAMMLTQHLQAVRIVKELVLLVLLIVIAQENIVPQQSIAIELQHVIHVLLQHVQQVLNQMPLLTIQLFRHVLVLKMIALDTMNVPLQHPVAQQMVGATP